ncbi:hypothetical protein [Photobacterium swingsii]|uniref:hypothetical protein n=1 Tax=Photobacterium swingsii TaxID=680026 RepID=UPI0040682C7F
MIQSKINAATDKAVFDAVNQHKITKDEILDMFFSRGVIVSKKTDKEDLAKDFSSFFHSYSDYDLLASTLGVSSRREKLTAYSLETTLNIDDVESTITKIKEQIESQGSSVTHRMSKDGSKIELSVSYQTLNLSKSDFQQVTVKDAVITIEKNENGLDVQYPQNDKLEEINNDIIDILEGKDKSLQKDDIDLTAFEKPADRSQFFDFLTQGVDKFKCIDVTDTYVFNPKQKISSGKTNDVHITSASLKGRGVNLSDELKTLQSQGFYIWKVTWKAIEEGRDSSDLYVFEAQFSDAEECKGFSFIVKGAYKRKDEGVVGSPDGHNVNRTPIPHLEEGNLNKLIKNSAWRAISKLNSKVAVEGDEDDNTKKQVVQA